jgi:hypothetical protein
LSSYSSWSLLFSSWCSFSFNPFLLLLLFILVLLVRAVIIVVVSSFTDLDVDDGDGVDVTTFSALDVAEIKSVLLSSSLSAPDARRS